MEKMKVYLSGPMTGIENQNEEEFIRAFEWLRNQGYSPITPLELAFHQDRSRAFSKLPAATYAQRLAYDIKAMAEMAQKVCVLPEWNNSVGARMEVAFAITAMHIPVFEAYTNKQITLDVEMVRDCETETMEEIIDGCTIKPKSNKELVS